MARLEHEEAAAEAEKEAIAELRRKTREEGGMSFKVACRPSLRN